MNLFEKPRGVQTRWFSFENSDSGRGQAGLTNDGAKGYAFDQVAADETKTLLDVAGSGTICRIWLTISDRSPDWKGGVSVRAVAHAAAAATALMERARTAVIANLHARGRHPRPCVAES